MPDHSTPTTEASRRRRGGQPGNLNALKYGEFSRRLDVDLSVFPHETRLVVAAAIWTAYKHQLEALPHPRTDETRRQAHIAALRQLHDCFASLDLTRNLTHLDVLRSLRPMFEQQIAAYEARENEKQKNKSN